MPVFLKRRDDLVVHHRAMLDRIRPGAKRELDAVGAMGVDRDLAAIGMGGVDQRPRFILKHAGRQPGAAVDAAGGGEFDDVGAAVDLAADHAAASFDTVAEVFGLRAAARPARR